MLLLLEILLLDILLLLLSSLLLLLLALLSPLPRAEYDFAKNLREARHQSTASASGITVVELPKIVMWLDSGAPPTNYIF